MSSFRIISLGILPAISSSIPAKFSELGINDKFFLTFTIGRGSPLLKDRYISLLGSKIPKLSVRLACGSASITSTLLPSLANPAEMFIAEVVLPTPPLWFTITIFLIGVIFNYMQILFLFYIFQKNILLFI